jgi:hypothetical protein
MDQKELAFRGVKILDIGYIAMIYFALAFFLSTWMDRRVFGEFDAEMAARKSTWRLVAECVLHIYMVGVIAYVVRNIVELVPSPFEGVAGLEHKRVKELTNATVFVFIFLFFQHHLREKLEYINKRIWG